MRGDRLDVWTRVDALLDLEQGVRRWATVSGSSAPSGLRREVERMASRAFRRHKDGRREQLVEIAVASAAWASYREASDSVAGLFGIEVAKAILLEALINDSPPRRWRNGRPEGKKGAEWGPLSPAYPSKSRALMRARSAALAGYRIDSLPGRLEEAVSTTSGSASFEHYGDAVRPPLDALALASAWILSSGHGVKRVVAVHLGGQAPRGALSTMLPDLHVDAVCPYLGQESGTTTPANAVVVNLPQPEAHYWQALLAAAERLPSSCRRLYEKAKALAAERGSQFVPKLIERVDALLAPNGMVIVMSAPDDGQHHLALDLLHEVGLEVDRRVGIDTVERPVWVSVHENPWSPCGGPTVHGRLVSVLRRPER